MTPGGEWDPRPGVQGGPYGNGVGADLDAFRRHRAQVQGEAERPISEALSRLPLSDQAALVFARLADVVVPGLADGCDVELVEDGDAPLRASAGASRASGARELDGMLRLSVHGPGHGPHPSYAGLVTLWWTARAPSSAEMMTADLLVRHVVSLVAVERLKSVVGRSDSRAAVSVVDAIATRTMNKAVGVVMHQFRCEDDDAEGRLREFAAAHDLPMHEAAAHVVRHGELPTVDGPSGRHLRSVAADELG